VEFQVNGVKQDYAMKLGDGGEAFFVFETSDDIPEALQTSPLVSPASSPEPTSGSSDNSGTVLQEPEYLDLSADPTKTRPSTAVVQNTGAPPFGQDVRAHTEDGRLPYVLLHKVSHAYIH
jgi:phosphatidate phosphatase LPIN